MAVLDFPDVFYVKVLNDSLEKLSSFTVDQNQELEHIILSMITIGTPGGTESFRLNLYSSDDVTTPVISSEWRNLSEFGSNKFGRLRFDFNGENLNKNISYNLYIEAQNYTRTTSFYVAGKLDWPDDVYTSTNASSRGVQMYVVGRR